MCINVYLCTGPPQIPNIKIQYSANGNAFNITWHEPFVHEQYPITNYTLTVLNQTSGETRNIIIPPNGEELQQVIPRESDEVFYNVCDQLVVTLTACNQLGESETATVLLGFPIGTILISGMHACSCHDIKLVL